MIELRVGDVNTLTLIAFLIGPAGSAVTVTSGRIARGTVLTQTLQHTVGAVAPLRTHCNHNNDNNKIVTYNNIYFLDGVISIATC